jgi:myo-inositol-1(or 4)-monophosphatase
MSDPSAESVLRVARESALAAGKILLRGLEEGFRVSSKGAYHDLVTNVDLESERLIVDRIRSHFPDHDVAGEEGKYPQTGSRWQWCIDPIDGTVNYTKGLPFFSVSIAVQCDGRLVAGVVHDPTRAETFWASTGAGAYLDGRRIHVSQAQDLRDAMLATGFHYDRGGPMLRTLDTMRRFLQGGVVEIRRIGSAALELAYVACGRLDGFWEHRLMPWDLAAGVLLVREAGGRATDLDGVDLEVRQSFTVATNGRLHEAVLGVIRAGAAAP